jgi:hypothetical protein
MSVAERMEIRISAPDAHEAIDLAKRYWRQSEPGRRIRTVASVRAVDDVAPGVHGPGWVVVLVVDERR